MNRREIIAQIEAAQRSVRSNLHRHDLDPTAAAHLHRAMSHLGEAFIATNEQGKARTVDQLVHDLNRIQRLMARLSQRQKQAPTITQTLRP